MSPGKPEQSRWSRALLRRPAVTAAAVFIGGIALHDWFVPRPLIFTATAIAACVFAIVFFRRAFFSSISLAIGIFCAGVAATQLAGFYFATSDIASFAADQSHLARLELRLDEPLRTVNSSSPGARPLPPRQVTTATVTRILFRDGWHDATGRANLQIDPPRDDLATGQAIRVLAMLQRPGGAMNPGQFDWAAYYRADRILASITIAHSDFIEIIGRDRPSPVARFRAWVRSLLAAGFTEKQSLDHSLLRALVLGDNDPELSDVREDFRRTGTSHHLAISGMHVAVLGWLVYMICKLLRLRPRISAGTALIFVTIYGVVALPSPPVIRSIFLCVSIVAGVMLRRKADAIQILAVSVLAMLACQPLDLFNAGFQLSFGTVLGLMILSRRFMPIFEDVDAQIAITARYGKPDPHMVMMHGARRWLLSGIVAGVIAWLCSMPLIAYHFEQLNPWAVIASLLLAPVVVVALIAGFLKIILTAIIPGGAGIWATIAAAPIALMRHGVDWLAHIPGSDVPFPSKSISLILVYYALLALCLLPIVAPKLKRAFSYSPILAVLLFVILPLTGGAAARLGDGSLRINVLAVGAGQCCVIELPDGKIILFDAGSATLTDPVRKCIAPFLRTRGRGSVDEIWLSHGDYDHVSAAAELIRDYGVDRVVVSSEFERHTVETPTDESLMETIRERHVPITQLHRGDDVDLAKGVTVDVLWPPAGSISTSNNSGLVLKLTYARRTILFPADIQQPPEAALLRDAHQLHCDVLLAPHHGSTEATTAAFVAAADPLYVISSNDRTLTQKQRVFEKLIGERTLLRTNRCGAITIQIDKNGGLSVVPFVQPAN